MSSRIVPAESRMEEDSIPEIRLKDESFVPQTNAIKVPSNKYTEECFRGTYRRGAKKERRGKFQVFKAPPIT